jgi:hypothetical protein
VKCWQSPRTVLSEGVAAAHISAASAALFASSDRPDIMRSFPLLIAFLCGLFTAGPQALAQAGSALPGSPTAPAAPAAAPATAPAGTSAAAPQTVPAASFAPGVLRIDWEVKNRFRLFRRESDFARHIAADRGDGVLAAEDRLERATDGRGWASDMFEHLCIDGAGRLMQTCERDGVRENYLAPVDHPVGVVLGGSVPTGAVCVWRFDDGAEAPREINASCDEEVRLRVRSGRKTVATVDVGSPDGFHQLVTTEIEVRDLLIAGLGDSIAAGEGNPDRPVALSDGGFCFKRFLGGGPSEYYRPGRAGFTGNRSCAWTASDAASDSDWLARGAQWLSAPCHLSMFSYQMRTALALAVENPHLAVTFLPLACSGATIETGFFHSQSVRECPIAPHVDCPGSVPPQLETLKALLAKARRSDLHRKLDLVLLTIGANDVYFSYLVANVIVESTTERVLFKRGGMLASVPDAQEVLDKTLPGEFAKLRAALKPLVGGDLARVVYVSYGHPALADGATCPGGRDGFDVHPAFAVDGERLGRVAAFVSDKFLPRIKALATCTDGVTCRNHDAMTFVDRHQLAFAKHGFCARAETDPAFDRSCFSSKGKSFATDPAVAATDPMACGMPASAYRAYAPRARWIRTANDSYFTAMTYPQGIPTLLKPTDIHDATWGILSAVYGGAVHPTAEGQAAMADAALPAVQAVLGLAAPPAVIAVPLPAPAQGQPNAGAPGAKPAQMPPAPVPGETSSRKF